MAVNGLRRAWFLTFYNCVSIVLQFLQDTFDALFAIMDQHSDRSGRLVFDCLVSGKAMCVCRHLNTFRGLDVVCVGRKFYAVSSG